MTVKIEKPKELQRVREAGKLSKELGTSIVMKPHISPVEFTSSPAVEKNKVVISAKGKREDIEEIVKDAVEETVLMKSAVWKI
jgi:hypothetical protein